MPADHDNGLFNPFYSPIIVIGNEITVSTSRFVNVLFQIKHMSNFQALEVVDRGSETQPRVVENLNRLRGRV